MSLRNKIIHLAHDNPPMREYLLPMLAEKTAADPGTIYITEVACGLWVREDAQAKKVIQDNLEGMIESVAYRLHERNKPRRPEPPVAPKGRGKKVVPVVAPEPEKPHEVIAVTVDRVWEEVQKSLTAEDLLRKLDDTAGFSDWFDNHILDAMASLGYITVGLVRSRPQIEKGKLVWEGKLFGRSQDEDTEVAGDSEEDDVERVITKLKGKSGYVSTRIEFVRGGLGGDYGDFHSVYPFTATFDVDPLKFLNTVFTKAKLPEVVAEMATRAIKQLE